MKLIAKLSLPLLSCLLVIACSSTGEQVPSDQTEHVESSQSALVIAGHCVLANGAETGYCWSYSATACRAYYAYDPYDCSPAMRSSCPCTGSSSCLHACDVYGDKVCTDNRLCYIYK